MAKLTYWEQLRLPQWQKKRLEILSRAEFSCESCGESTQELHVHHTYYEKGLAPWEYPDESLQALCKDCHAKAEDLQKLLKRQIGKIGFDVEQLYGYALGIETMASPEVPVAVTSFCVAQGLSAFWRIGVYRVINALRESQIDGKRLMELVSEEYPRKATE